MSCFVSDTASKPFPNLFEVKARTSNKFGKGFDAVSETKQDKLVLGAKFLQNQKKFKKYNVRFDVASIDSGVVTYIENAFEAKNS